MSPEILSKIALALDISCKEHVCLWCLYVFAFVLFARKSNLVPDTSKDFSKCLLRKDVRIVWEQFNLFPFIGQKSFKVGRGFCNYLY